MSTVNHGPSFSGTTTVNGVVDCHNGDHTENKQQYHYHLNVGGDRIRNFFVKHFQFGGNVSQIESLRTSINDVTNKQTQGDITCLKHAFIALVQLAISKQHSTIDKIFKKYKNENENENKNKKKVLTEIDTNSDYENNNENKNETETDAHWKDKCYSQSPRDFKMIITGFGSKTAQEDISQLVSKGGKCGKGAKISQIVVNQSMRHAVVSYQSNSDLEHALQQLLNQKLHGCNVICFKSCENDPTPSPPPPDDKKRDKKANRSLSRERYRGCGRSRSKSRSRSRSRSRDRDTSKGGVNKPISRPPFRFGSRDKEQISCDNEIWASIFGPDYTPMTMDSTDSDIGVNTAPKRVGHLVYTSPRGKGGIGGGAPYAPKSPQYSD